MQKNENRRSFLVKSAAVAAAPLVLGLNTPAVHAAENNEIKIALVGSGSRGTSAAMQALSTAGPTKLVAVADVFEDKVTNSVKAIADNFKDNKDAVIDVPQERQFVGFDAYKHAIDAAGPGGVVLLATAPAFRPMHVEYAVAKGCHIFMEKSFAVDAPGTRRILAAGKLASEKNLKIVGGLCCRHKPALQAAVEQLHNGIIGERITCWAYREHGPVPLYPKREDETVVGHQIRNYSNFTYLNGSFLLDWLIHNLDVCCWAKGAYPVKAQGLGGRQQRTEKDQLFDHYGVEYTFADGTKLVGQGRHQKEVWNCFQSTIQGATGCAVIGEGVQHQKIFKGWNPAKENVIWEFKEKEKNMYQIEHDVLFDAIRNDKPHNETERSAKSGFVGILGRMACESGKEITWEDAMKSEVSLATDLDKLTLDGPAPVMPDKDGNYPIAMPGVTQAV